MTDPPGRHLRSPRLGPQPDRHGADHGGGARGRPAPRHRRARRRAGRSLRLQRRCRQRAGPPRRAPGRRAAGRRPRAADGGAAARPRACARRRRRRSSRTYATEGQGPAMARFLALIMHDGEVDASFVTQPAPNPAAFGLSAEDDGSRTDPMMRSFAAHRKLRAQLDRARRRRRPAARRRWRRLARGGGGARRPLGRRGARPRGDRVPRRPLRVPRRRVRPDGRARAVRGALLEVLGA